MLKLLKKIWDKSRAAHNVKTWVLSPAGCSWLFIAISIECLTVRFRIFMVFILEHKFAHQGQMAPPATFYSTTFTGQLSCFFYVSLEIICIITKHLIRGVSPKNINTIQIQCNTYKFTVFGVTIMIPDVAERVCLHFLLLQRIFVTPFMNIEGFFVGNQEIKSCHGSAIALSLHFHNRLFLENSVVISPCLDG